MIFMTEYIDLSQSPWKHNKAQSIKQRSDRKWHGRETYTLFSEENGINSERTSKI